MLVGYTTAVQALDMGWIQFQAVLCMSQGMAVAPQLDVHLGKVALMVTSLGRALKQLSYSCRAFV